MSNTKQFHLNSVLHHFQTHLIWTPTHHHLKIWNANDYHSLERIIGEHMRNSVVMSQVKSSTVLMFDTFCSHIYSVSAFVLVSSPAVWSQQQSQPFMLNEQGKSRAVRNVRNATTHAQDVHKHSATRTNFSCTNYTLQYSLVCDVLHITRCWQYYNVKTTNLSNSAAIFLFRYVQYSISITCRQHCTIYNDLNTGLWWAVMRWKHKKQKP